MCGFLGHNASLGCNKCYKKFPSPSLGYVDYSGYARESWPPRNVQMHRESCRELLKETTKTGMRKAESTRGVRYSALLALPYFNPVRFTVVDVMHNLFLGTGKYVFKLWLATEILTKDSLKEIERRIRTFSVPGSVGRLPINITSNHGGYTASQWQSWITLYSPVVLKGLLPTEHFQCWLLFVRACSILSERVVKKVTSLLLIYCC